MNSSEILLDNDLNLILTLNVDSIQFNGVTFEKGCQVKYKVDGGSSFIVKGFELIVSKWNEKYETTSIMLVGENEASMIENVIKII